MHHSASDQTIRNELIEDDELEQLFNRVIVQTPVPMQSTLPLLPPPPPVREHSKRVIAQADQLLKALDAPPRYSDSMSGELGFDGDEEATRIDRYPRASRSDADDSDAWAEMPSIPFERPYARELVAPVNSDGAWQGDAPVSLDPWAFLEPDAPVADQPQPYKQQAAYKPLPVEPQQAAYEALVAKPLAAYEPLPAEPQQNVYDVLAAAGYAPLAEPEQAVYEPLADELEPAGYEPLPAEPQQAAYEPQPQPAEPQQAAYEPQPYQPLPHEQAAYEPLPAEPQQAVYDRERAIHDLAFARGAAAEPLPAEPQQAAYEPQPYQPLSHEQAAYEPQPYEAQLPASESHEPRQASYQPAPSHEPADEPAADSAPARIGEVITVFGCRGGCGATTIAVNLAGSLAAEGKEVCIVDLDVQLGDVLVTLDLDSTGAASIVNLARDVHHLDPAMLKRRLVRHESGVFVLAQGGKLEEIDDTLPSKIPALLATLARNFDTVIIDGVDDFSELALAALDAANVVALVLTQDVIAVRRARRVIDICRKLEVPDHKVRPILNCYRSSSRIDRDSVSTGLTLDVAATIVEDERTTRRSQTSGQLLHEIGRRKRVTRDVAALQQLTTTRAPEPSAAEPAADHEGNHSAAPADVTPVLKAPLVGKLATAGGPL